MAILYKAQGEYQKAEPLYLEALNISKKILGDEHPDTASSYNNLAILYKAQGEYPHTGRTSLSRSFKYK